MSMWPLLPVALDQAHNYDRDFEFSSPPPKIFLVSGPFAVNDFPPLLECLSLVLIARPEIVKLSRAQAEFGVRILGYVPDILTIERVLFVLEVVYKQRYKSLQ